MQIMTYRVFEKFHSYLSEISVFQSFDNDGFPKSKSYDKDGWHILDFKRGEQNGGGFGRKEQQGGGEVN